MTDDILIIKSKKYKGGDDYKTFSIRIKEELVENIDSISTQTGHSRNEKGQYRNRHCHDY